MLLYFLGVGVWHNSAEEGGGRQGKEKDGEDWERACVGENDCVCVCDCDANSGR